jgi:hypothetical protein
MLFGGGSDAADAVWPRCGPRPGAGSATAPFARAEPEPRLVTAVRYRLRLAVAAAARQANTDRGVAARSRTTRPFQQRTARGDRAALAPTPAGTRSRRAGQRWVVGGARWAWTHRPRRQAVGLVGRSASRDRTGDGAPSAATAPHHAKQQHENDHDDQHPQPCRHDSLLGRCRSRSSRHYCRPPRRTTPRVQATSRAGIDGCAAGSRGPLHPRDLPADLGCGRVPARPARRPRAGPGGPSPSCHAQPAPAQPYRPAPQKRRTRQAATDPTRPQRARPAGYGEAEKSLPCLGGGRIQAWLC